MNTTNGNSGNTINEPQLTADRLSLISICLDGDAAVDLRQFVRATPFLRLNGEVHTYLTEDDPGLSWMHPPGPDICLIDFDKDRSLAIATAERIHEQLPQTAIFAISTHYQPELIIEAMRCGCSEYIIKPVGREQLLETISRVGARKREKRDQTNGQVLTIIGAKGGTGTTTLATHLAAILAKSCSCKTLLVDLHHTVGEAALFLGITRHQYHFYELVDNLDRLDAEFLQSFVLHHPSGLDLLPAPDFGGTVKHSSGEAVGQAIDFVRTKYDFVLLDCPPVLTDHTLAAISRSDHVYIITTPEVPSLRNVARLLEHFRNQELPQNRIEVILNRHQARNGAISESQIERVIRRKIFLKVPNQYDQVIRTINGGDPSAQLPSSQVARTVLGWAEMLTARPGAADGKKKSGKSILSLFTRS